MSSSNQYPPEKQGEYPPPPTQPPRPGAGKTEPVYPPVPIPSAPSHHAPQYAQAGEGEHNYSTPAQGDYQYPPPPPGLPPNQQYQPAQYQPTSWVPEQNLYTQSPVMTGAAGTHDTHHESETTNHGKLSAWDKTRSTSKAGFDKLWNGFEKLGVPVNRLTNKIGSEAFWPQSLDKESDKCARILKSFCKDGFYSERPSDPSAPQEGPKGKPKVLVKIPTKVIKNAVALAIFTTMRTGLWISGAGGSGVLVSRLPDGSWSPPSGLLIHTAGVGFMAGIDIYDCVLVINTPQALAAFKKVRLSLGGELSLAAGPVGIGGVGEFDMGQEKTRKPIWTYMKSRGLYAGVQIDGSIVIERNDENARFYGERIPAADILSGKLKSVPQSTQLLTEVLKEAEERNDANQNVLSKVHEVPPPGDMLLEKGAEATNDQKAQFGDSDAVRYA